MKVNARILNVPVKKFRRRAMTPTSIVVKYEAAGRRPLFPNRWINIPQYLHPQKRNSEKFLSLKMEKEHFYIKHIK